MKCKNCGMAVDKNSSLCINCGAVIKANKKNYKKSSLSAKKVILFVLAVLFVFASGFASFCYFNQKNSDRTKPELVFSSGQGIINQDESVLYSSIADSSKIEYIHSAKLYEGSVSDDDLIKPDAVDEDYKYTKRVDKAIKAIFFDLDKQNLRANENYTYTIEMTFSFIGDSTRYTYYESINFTTSLKQDVSHEVFDYSLVQETTENIVEQENESLEYIYDGYWYSKPYNNKQSIYSVKFRSDNSCTITYYEKGNDSKCVVKTVDATFTTDSSALIADLSDNQKISFNIDIKNKRLTDSSGNIFARRQNNSVENAEKLMK